MDDLLHAIKSTDERCVLATIIKVEGSAYRREGTSMLFMESGEQVGMISAGCLEVDLALQANILLEKDMNNWGIFVYDMSIEDDLSWGRGAGCNGKIHILLEKVEQALRNQLCVLGEHLEQGRSVISVKTIGEGLSAIRTIFITKDQQVFGDQLFIPKILMEITQQISKPSLQYREDLQANIFAQQFKPKPRLFIFGAGADVRPLAFMGDITGFSVFIWDWRLALLDQAHFPNANFIRKQSILETIENIHFLASDSIIIMTHDFQKDQEILQALLPFESGGYLGILGPRKRTLRLLDQPIIPVNLHSPVGLAISAEGPEEIAISILAELIQTQRKSSSEKGPLFEKKRDHRYLSSSREK